jgi:nuclear transport factor 2 (NTF2) superfamily protein
LLTNLELNFNNKLKVFDTTKIILTDTSFNKIKGVAITIDSTRKIVTIKNKWPEETNYRLIIEKDAVSDSTDNLLAKSDTIRFVTKRQSDYGSLLLRFTNLNLEMHPIIQFIENSEVVKSIPVTGSTWSDKLFTPGDYELRILYDTNNNGIWDPGNYDKKIQPENAITLDKKLVIKADWENERDVKL